MKTVKSTQIWLKNNNIKNKPANSTSELVSNYHNFDGLKSKELFGWKRKLMNTLVWLTFLVVLQ